MNKPNLFIVGQPKAGTRSLYEMLRKHPEVCMSLDKEPGFFISKKKYKTEKEYLNLFKNKNKKILGEASTNYIYSKETANKIKKFNPKAKIIILLREPVSFLRSLYQMNYFYLSENRKINEAITSKKYMGRTKYFEYLKNYIEVFPKKNIKIILHEDYLKNTQETFEDICNFLGIDSEFVPDIKKGHTARKLRFRGFFFFLRKMGINDKDVLKILPKKYFDKIKNKLYREEKIKLKPELKKKIKLMLRTEVKKTNDLLHKKGFLDKKKNLLKKWDY